MDYTVLEFDDKDEGVICTRMDSRMGGTRVWHPSKLDVR